MTYVPDDTCADTPTLCPPVEPPPDLPPTGLEPAVEALIGNLMVWGFILTVVGILGLLLLNHFLPPERKAVKTLLTTPYTVEGEVGDLDALTTAHEEKP